MFGGFEDFCCAEITPLRQRNCWNSSYRGSQIDCHAKVRISNNHSLRIVWMELCVIPRLNNHKVKLWGIRPLIRSVNYKVEEDENVMVLGTSQNEKCSKWFVMLISEGNWLLSNCKSLVKAKSLICNNAECTLGQSHMCKKVSMFTSQRQQFQSSM